MNTRSVIKQLRQQYPNKTIKLLPGNNPTEIICEFDPTQDHKEYSNTIAVIDKSVPHVHNKSTETYTVLKGVLLVIKNTIKYPVAKGERIVINPGEIHYAQGNETWVSVLAKPGWVADDHIIVSI